MRVLHIFLAGVLWLGPVFQAYAGTLSGIHCRARAYVGMTALDAAPDRALAEHRGHAGVSMWSDGGASQAAQCDCGCVCGHAGVISAAIVPSVRLADVSVPEHFNPANDAAPAHAEHPVPQRPPASLS